MLCFRQRRVCASLCVHFGAEEAVERRGGKGGKQETRQKALSRFLKQFRIQLRNKKKHFSLAFIHDYPLPSLPFLTPFHFVFEFQISMHPVELSPPPTPLPSAGKCATFLLRSRRGSRKVALHYLMYLPLYPFPALLDVPPSTSTFPQLLSLIH